MNVQEIASRLRAIADRMQRAHRDELREQNAVEFMSERANDVRILANELVTSLDARQLEVRLGSGGLTRRRGGSVTGPSGRVIDATNLFKARSTA
jgi:hypothetical protein